MGREQQRDRRYQVRVPVTLVQGRKSHHLLTDDVSFGGMFLRTTQFPPTRQLVQIRIQLEPDGDELVVHAMVARVSAPDDSEAHGIGVHLFSLTAEARQRWNQFIHYVRDRYPES